MTVILSACEKIKLQPFEVGDQIQNTRFSPLKNILAAIYLLHLPLILRLLVCRLFVILINLTPLSLLLSRRGEQDFVKELRPFKPPLMIKQPVT